MHTWWLEKYPTCNKSSVNFSCHSYQSSQKVQAQPLKTSQVKVKAAQPCPTLCDHMDCIYILQARILEWVAIPFSKGTSQPRDQT